MVHDQANEHEGGIQKPIYEFGNKHDMSLTIKLISYKTFKQLRVVTIWSICLNQIGFIYAW